MKLYNMKKRFSEPKVGIIKFDTSITLYKTEPVVDDGGIWTSEILL